MIFHLARIGKNKNENFSKKNTGYIKIRTHIRKNSLKHWSNTWSAEKYQPMFTYLFRKKRKRKDQEKNKYMIIIKIILFTHDSFFQKNVWPISTDKTQIASRKTFLNLNRREIFLELPIYGNNFLSVVFVCEQSKSPRWRINIKTTLFKVERLKGISMHCCAFFDNATQLNFSQQIINAFVVHVMYQIVWRIPIHNLL